MDWLPPYTRRISKRAKHLQLKVSATKGLEIVVPEVMQDVSLDKFLLEKRPWIIKHKHLIEQSQEQQRVLPKHVNLQTINQCWTVNFDKAYAKPTIVERPSFGLILLCDENDFACGAGLLKKWLLIKAQYYLVDMLQKIAKETGLDYQEAKVRFQKSCWGSCTREHVISLNAQLLMFPYAITRYVMIHELCHTRYLHHRPSFWKLVNTFDPDYEQHKSILRHAERSLDDWLLYG